MSDKPRWPHAAALAVGEELVAALAPHCHRIMICGSLRRQKETVGDVEIVFVPRAMPVIAPVTDFFAPPQPMDVDLAVVAIAEMLVLGTLAKRRNILDGESWGPKNKYARHVASGVPIDLFATTEAAWWNNVVCRTGGKTSNEKISMRARELGWKWCTYREGFERCSGPDRGRMHVVTSEREVWEFLRLPYLEPEERP